MPFAVAPSDCAQTSHAFAHALLQQKPSTQDPFAQSPLPPGHGWPTTLKQTPVALQVWVPVQLGGSGALVTAAHVPGVAALHD